MEHPKKDKIFTQVGSLKTHKQSMHEGIKAKIKLRKCELCDKSFESLNKFKIHFKAVHKGAQTFSCSLCDKSYTQYNLLKAHKKHVHEGLNFSCDQIKDKENQVPKLPKLKLKIHHTPSRVNTNENMIEKIEHQVESSELHGLKLKINLKR